MRTANRDKVVKTFASKHLGVSANEKSLTPALHPAVAMLESVGDGYLGGAMPGTHAALRLLRQKLLVLRPRT